MSAVSRSRGRARMAVLLTATTVLAAAPIGVGPAHAQVSRVRQGNAADVSRASWSGPAYTMNGSGGIVTATMTRAIDAIRGGTGTLDVVVLAGSGSTTPECDVIIGLTGVNSCTTLTLTAARDGNDTQVNTDIRNAEFVYFAGGDQCRYVAWKGTALETSVESVVARGGGVGGGSAGHHVNSDIVYDACTASATSAIALDDPYDRSLTFTTGMFRWPHYANTINDSHFVERDRMGRTMAFVARAIKDGRTSGGKAWGVGVDQNSSLYVDRAGLATLSGGSAYVVLGDHQPEVAVAGQPLTYSNFKIWRLGNGQTYDFANRPTCGYYLRSVTAGVPSGNLYSGTPVTDCSTPPGGSTFAEVESNDSRSAANDLSTASYPLTVTGDMKSGTDRDYFALALTQGQTLAVDCAVPSAYDADVYLLDSGGSTLTRSINDGAGVDESLSFTRTASGTGTYYLDVEAYSGSGTADYACALTRS